MIDNKFYTIASPITLAKVQEITGAILEKSEFANKIISGVAGLEIATENDIIFFANEAVAESLKHPEFKEMLSAITAGACLINDEHKNLVPNGIPVLTTKDPRGAFIKLQKYFYQDNAYTAKGIMDTARIADNVKFADKESVFIGYGAVIESGVEIGKNCYIGHNAIVKYGCTIGNNCRILDNAVVSHCVMGNDVHIGESSVIGSTGFGWHSGAAGHNRVPQIGRVILEDFVEIDCNSCVDRGAIGDTVIGAGTKIDNLVQIGHNNKVGKNCIFAGMSGMAGSNQVGNFVLLGAQAGLSGFLKIGDFAQIAGQSGVMKNVDAGAKVMGSPAIDAKMHFKQQIILKNAVLKKNKI
jgi:UDP-3-O-[3-hydroxymyristoyl] glucosamine N-acyltransferase